MGRAKLEMKYRENSRARLSTYMTRMKGLKKKASEISILCGVDVLISSFSPKLNTIQFWPEKYTSEFQRIRERYLQFRRSEKPSGKENNAGRCLPMPSSSLPSNIEENVALEIKLREARERLCFLKARELQPMQVMDSSPFQEEHTMQLVQVMTIPSSSPSLDQPSSFGSQILPAHADFTADDWSWCDSLVDLDDF